MAGVKFANGTIIKFDTLDAFVNHPDYDNIVHIDCGFNEHVTKLPELPKSLVKLYCNKTSITELPTLPKTLKVLCCDDCNLLHLPELHEGLEKLMCNKTGLLILPFIPSTLKVLSIRLNELPQMPKLKSTSLELIDCCCNNLTSLLQKGDSFPDTLKALYCSENNLTELPKLPKDLKILWCSHNKLIDLGNINDFPQTLEVFSCATNELKQDQEDSFTKKVEIYASTLNKLYECLCEEESEQIFDDFSDGLHEDGSHEDLSGEEEEEEYSDNEEFLKT